MKKANRVSRNDHSVYSQLEVCNPTGWVYTQVFGNLGTVSVQSSRVLKVKTYSGMSVSSRGRRGCHRKKAL